MTIYGFTDKVIYPSFNLTSSFGPGNPNHIEPHHIQEFNKLSPKEKWKEFYGI